MKNSLKNNVWMWTMVLVILFGTASATDTILDKYRLKAAQFSGASSFLIDQQGNYFAAGGSYQVINNVRACHCVVRKSTDKGATWKTVDNYVYDVTASTQSDIYPSLGIDPAGNIYTAAYGFDKNQKTHWIVRKGTNAGESWSTVDDFQYQAGYNAQAVGVTADSEGTLYVLGFGTDTKNYHWIVRKSTDGGASWVNIDDYKSSYLLPGGLTIDLQGHIYAVGSVTNKWAIRRSVDGGATWAEVDQFSMAGAPTFGRAIVSDAEGHLFASGVGNNRWIVRGSSDGGATWNLIDNFSLGGEYSDAKAITVDAQGNVYAAGVSADNQGQHWLVRVSADQGGSWSIFDSYQKLPGSGAVARSIFVDQSDNVFTAGMASDKAGGWWIVLLNSK